MTHIEIDMPAPPETNLRDLASSTLSVFNLLRPWYRSGYSFGPLQSIKLQAQAYMKALGFSIGAAQIGYSIAEDALAFAEHIDAGTEEDRQSYLRGMYEIALRGQDNAEKARNGFKNVRREVGQLIENAKNQQNQGHSNMLNTSSRLKELEKGISTLETFSSSISSYISWWNTMTMNHNAQSTRIENVVYRYNALRIKSVIQKWRELKQEYADYTDKIRAIQDAEPELFAEPEQALFGKNAHPSYGAENLPKTLDGGALLFAPVFALSRYGHQDKLIRRRDRFRAWGHRVWEEIVS